jgi:hypothetical protein
METRATLFWGTFVIAPWVFPVLYDLTMQVDNVVVAEDDIVCVEFCVLAIMDDSHAQRIIPLCPSMVSHVAESSDVHRASP